MASRSSCTACLVCSSGVGWFIFLIWMRLAGRRLRNLNRVAVWCLMFDVVSLNQIPPTLLWEYFNQLLCVSSAIQIWNVPFFKNFEYEAKYSSPGVFIWSFEVRQTTDTRSCVVWWRWPFQSNSRTVLRKKKMKSVYARKKKHEKSAHTKKEISRWCAHEN